MLVGNYKKIFGDKIEATRKAAAEARKKTRLAAAKGKLDVNLCTVQPRADRLHADTRNALPLGYDQPLLCTMRVSRSRCDSRCPLFDARPKMRCLFISHTHVVLILK